MESENLRLILPLLRPRSDALNWYGILLIAVLCTGLALLALMYLMRNRRQAAALKKRFYQRGAELKLKPSQTALLYSIAQDHRMNNPRLLFSSVHIFDQHVGPHADQLAQVNAEDPTLAELDKIRTWLEFDQIPRGQLLSSTREMPVGQILDLALARTDARAEDASASWVLTERNAGFLVVAPLVSHEHLEKNQSRPKKWPVGQALEANFWHADGIEYAFSTKVLKTLPQGGQLALAHTNEVLHTQQRHFLRIDTDMPLTLYGLPIDQEKDLVHHLTQALAAHSNEEPDQTAPKPTAQSTPSPTHDTVSLKLEDLPCVLGRTQDLSAGGLALVCNEALPPVRYFLLDPAFKGEYPLAGLVCQQVRHYRSPQGYHLQAQFIDLPPVIENELVRLINQHQITANHPPNKEARS